MKRITELFWLSVCVAIIAFATFIVVGACAALVPVRWIIDWDARRKAEGDKLTS